MNLSASKLPGDGVVFGGTGVPCGSKPLVWLSKAAGASVGPDCPLTFVGLVSEANSRAANAATIKSLRTLITSPLGLARSRAGAGRGRGCACEVSGRDKGAGILRRQSPDGRRRAGAPFMSE